MTKIPNNYLKVGDLLRDHHGKGSNEARVEEITGTKVRLRYISRNARWPSSKRAGCFELPLWFMQSKACGWTLVDREP